MDLVRQLRREKGWTQEQLAINSGLSRATIQRVEGGKVVPDKETALSLAAAFGVHPARLRQDAGLAACVLRVAAINNERNPTADELRLLPPEIRRFFTEFVDAKSECEEVTRAMQEASERSSAAHEERMEIVSLVRRLANEVSGNPGDPDLRGAYRKAIARLAEQPLPNVDETFALGDRAMRATRCMSEKGMALARLLARFA